jgi:hypothetical protein
MKRLFAAMLLALCTVYDALADRYEITDLSKVSGPVKYSDYVYAIIVDNQKQKMYRVKFLFNAHGAYFVRFEQCEVYKSYQSAIPASDDIVTAFGVQTAAPGATIERDREIFQINKNTGDAQFCRFGSGTFSRRSPGNPICAKVDYSKCP